MHPQSENLQPLTLGIWNHPISAESPESPVGHFCTATMSAVPKVMEGSGGTVVPGAQAHSDPPIEMSGSWNVSEVQDDAAAMRCIYSRMTVGLGHGCGQWQEFEVGLYYKHKEYLRLEWQCCHSV